MSTATAQPKHHDTEKIESLRKLIAEADAAAMWLTYHRVPHDPYDLSPEDAAAWLAHNPEDAVARRWQLISPLDVIAAEADKLATSSENFLEVKRRVTNWYDARAAAAAKADRAR